MELSTLRLEMLEAAHGMVKAGLVASVWGNISARIKGTGYALVTPSGVDYDTLQPDDLVVVDIESGKVIEGRLKPTSELPMHLAILRGRTDVNAVMHTHSIYASACSVAHREVPAIVEDLVQVVGGSVGIAKYALPGSPELGCNVVKALGKKNAVLLANHGVVGVAPDLNEVLRVSIIVEKGAQIYSIAKGLGNPILISHEDVEWLRHSYQHSYGQK